MPKLSREIYNTYFPNHTCYNKLINEYFLIAYYFSTFSNQMYNQN